MKNYIRSAFGLTVMVSLMVFGLRYIPTEIVEKIGVKPIDIIADLNRGNTIEELDQLDAEAGADTYQEDTPQEETKEVTLPTVDSNTITTVVTETRKPTDSINLTTEKYKDLISFLNYKLVIPSTPKAETPPVPKADSVPAIPIKEEKVIPKVIIPIVDFSADGAMLQMFTTRLSNIRSMSRPLRIGFMGDSFIEGDLLTNDFREMMQTKYGGGGVGFVPITSQVAGFRQTVAHKFEDWTQRSIMRNKEGVFTISAFNYSPEENSYVEYKGSRNKKHLSSFKQARMLFISHGRSVIRATVNGNQEYLFNTEPSEELQEFILEGDITSIRYSVSDVAGFTAYGVFLDDNKGVCVDNFSVRGNSGELMGRVNTTLSRQFRQLVPYDLIVLQYGLNVVSSKVTQYSNYQKQMTSVVNHIKRCFPNAAIMIMSVGDRGTRVNGEIVTMPGVKPMVRAQKQVAEDCGVLFWSTYDAMMAEGGMKRFVKKGWASKDLVHVSARVGKTIATKLHDAVIVASEE